MINHAMPAFRLSMDFHSGLSMSTSECFDTGQSDLFLKSANILGINLADADAIVISHGHYDHTGGLSEILNRDRKATVYIHP